MIKKFILALAISIPMVFTATATEDTSTCWDRSKWDKHLISDGFVLSQALPFPDGSLGFEFKKEGVATLRIGIYPNVEVCGQ